MFARNNSTNSLNVDESITDQLSMKELYENYDDNESSFEDDETDFEDFDDDETEDDDDDEDDISSDLDIISDIETDDIRHIPSEKDVKSPPTKLMEKGRLPKLSDNLSFELTIQILLVPRSDLKLKKKKKEKSEKEKKPIEEKASHRRSMRTPKILNNFISKLQNKTSLSIKKKLKKSTNSNNNLINNMNKKEEMREVKENNSNLSFPNEKKWKIIYNKSMNIVPMRIPTKYNEFCRVKKLKNVTMNKRRKINLKRLHKLVSRSSSITSLLLTIVTNEDNKHSGIFVYKYSINTYELELTLPIDRLFSYTIGDVLTKKYLKEQKETNRSKDFKKHLSELSLMNGKKGDSLRFIKIIHDRLGGLFGIIHQKDCNQLISIFKNIQFNSKHIPQRTYLFLSQNIHENQNNSRMVNGGNNMHESPNDMNLENDHGNDEEDDDSYSLNNIDTFWLSNYKKMHDPIVDIESCSKFIWKRLELEQLQSSSTTSSLASSCSSSEKVSYLDEMNQLKREGIRRRRRQFEEKMHRAFNSTYSKLSPNENIEKVNKQEEKIEIEKTIKNEVDLNELKCQLTTKSILMNYQLFQKFFGEFYYTLNDLIYCSFCTAIQQFSSKSQRERLKFQTRSPKIPDRKKTIYKNPMNSFSTYQLRQVCGNTNDYFDSTSSTSPTRSIDSPKPQQLTEIDLKAIEQYLLERQSFYMIESELLLFIGTYNVNEQKAPNINELYSWFTFLHKSPEGNTTMMPDIIVIGFQEIDMSPLSSVRTTVLQELSWLNILEDLFRYSHSGYRFVKLIHIRKVGLMEVIYVRERLKPFINDLSTDYLGTGKHCYGNKGAIAIRFDVCLTSFCFVCVHFAAHLENLRRRQMDYRSIFAWINFQRNHSASRSALQHERLFVFGDLNYRLDGKLSSPNLMIDDIKEKLKWKENYHFLLKNYDQLIRERQNEMVFSKPFQESYIDFLPTYKFDNHTDHWDSSEKKRTPSWTDRILYRSIDFHQYSYDTRHRNDLIRCLLYENAMNVRQSDHKPIFGYYSCRFRDVDALGYDLIFSQYQLEKENDLFHLSTSNICFSNVTPYRLFERNIEVHNTSFSSPIRIYILSMGASLIRNLLNLVEPMRLTRKSILKDIKQYVQTLGVLPEDILNFNKFPLYLKFKVDGKDIDVKKAFFDVLPSQRTELKIQIIFNELSFHSLSHSHYNYRLLKHRHNNHLVPKKEKKEKELRSQVSHEDRLYPNLSYMIDHRTREMKEYHLMSEQYSPLLSSVHQTSITLLACTLDDSDETIQQQNLNIYVDVLQSYLIGNILSFYSCTSFKQIFNHSPYLPADMDLKNIDHYPNVSKEEKIKEEDEDKLDDRMNQIADEIHRISSKYLFHYSIYRFHIEDNDKSAHLPYQLTFFEQCINYLYANHPFHFTLTFQMKLIENFKHFQSQRFQPNRRIRRFLIEMNRLALYHSFEIDKNHHDDLLTFLNHEIELVGDINVMRWEIIGITIQYFSSIALPIIPSIYYFNLLQQIQNDNKPTKEFYKKLCRIFKSFFHFQIIDRLILCRFCELFQRLIKIHFNDNSILMRLFCEQIHWIILRPPTDINIHYLRTFILQTSTFESKEINEFDSLSVYHQLLYKDDNNRFYFESDDCISLRNKAILVTETLLRFATKEIFNM
ncbi:hypothetical protein SNEBB_003490 [Seison nebaliae]|nr:hypothetical protein SNEBB_003490 [Seison nebaliae]